MWYCCGSISHLQACVWFTSLNLNGPSALMFGKRNISHNKNIRQNMCHGRFFNKASMSFSRHTPLSQGLFSSPNPSHPPPHCPFSSRVICSVSCLPLLAFPLHLWLVNLCKALIGQSFKDLPLLTLMKTPPPPQPPLSWRTAFSLWGRPLLGSPPVFSCTASPAIRDKES